MDINRIDDKILIRKKLISLIGSKFRVFDSNENLFLFSKMKAFKLREDIKVYTGEDMVEEVLSIKARNIIDFSATYDVFDSKTGEKIGALKRKGMKSILKDEWLILNNNDMEIGKIKEDSTGMALIRRFLFNLIPQVFYVDINGTNVASYKQNRNPFSTKLYMDFSQDTSKLFDKRLGIASGILLCAIEGKQD